MIAAFAMYATVLSLLIGGLALLAHRAAALLRRPTRFVWIVAMALMTFAPIGLTLMSVRDAEPAVEPVFEATTFVESPPLVAPPAQAADAPTILDSATARTAFERPAPRSWPSWSELLTRAESVSAPLDRPLAALWLLGSATLLAFAWRATRALQQLRSTLNARDISGATVHVSDAIGPAAVGGVHPVIVVPEWVLQLDQSLLTLVLRHEQEHIAKRDPALLTAGLVLLILVPWLPALWWGWRRLRLAIELDCDARVLRAHPNTRAYAQLLLFVSQHRTPRLRGWPLVSSLTLAINPQVTHLKQRINAMTMRRSKNPMRVLTVLAGMIGTGAMALVIPAPVLLAPSAPSESSALAAGGATASAIVAVTYAAMPFTSTTGRGATAPEILLYSSGSVSLGFGNQSRSALRDTIRLTALPAFTADVTNGDLHVVIRRGAPSISLRGYLQSAPTEEFGATGQHLMLPKGGAGMRILGAAPMPSQRQLLEERVVEMQARNRETEVRARNRAMDSARRERELTALERLIVDSAAARRSELELRRVKELSTYVPESRQVQEIERQLRTLNETLGTLPPEAITTALADAMQALRRREAGLRLELAQLRGTYEDGSRPLKPVQSELEQIGRRMQELSNASRDLLSRIPRDPARRDSTRGFAFTPDLTAKWMMVVRGTGRLTGPWYILLQQRDSMLSGELFSITNEGRALEGRISQKSVSMRVRWAADSASYAVYNGLVVSPDRMEGSVTFENKRYNFIATRR